MKTTKTFFLATIIVLLCVSETSCIPDSQNSPSPTNTFEVNIAINYLFYLGPDRDTSKTLVIDGDSIKFMLFTFTHTAYLQHSIIIFVKSPDFEILNVKVYPIIDHLNIYDSTYDMIDGNTLPAGNVINDAYTANPWLPFTSFNYAYIAETRLYGNEDFSIGPAHSYGLLKNTDQYIVFRKQTGTGYRYYWIKVRRDETSGFLPTIKVLNGKYQMNNIVTGQ